MSKIPLGDEGRIRPSKRIAELGLDTRLGRDPMVAVKAAAQIDAMDIGERIQILENPDVAISPEALVVRLETGHEAEAAAIMHRYKLAPEKVDETVELALVKKVLELQDDAALAAIAQLTPSVDVAKKLMEHEDRVQLALMEVDPLWSVLMNRLKRMAG